MLTSNSGLMGKVVRFLQHMPKGQRQTAALEMQKHYEKTNGTSKDEFSLITMNGSASSKPILHKVTAEEFDPEMKDLVLEEADRQTKSIDLIASSSVGIPRVGDFTSVLGNKSSPGYPWRRFFAGDSVIDKVEKLCYKRALEAFNLNQEEWGVNVQCLSGSIANL